MNPAPFMFEAANQSFDFVSGIEPCGVGFEDYVGIMDLQPDFDFGHLFNNNNDLELCQIGGLSFKDVALLEDSWSYIEGLQQDVNSIHCNGTSACTDSSSVSAEDNEFQAFVNSDAWEPNAQNIPDDDLEGYSTSTSSITTSLNTTKWASNVTFVPYDGQLPRRQNSSKAVQHTKSEWEAIKPYFLQYYLHEEMDLRAVRHKLARCHNFHATEQMFKRRINGWGAFKKTDKAKNHYVNAYISAHRQFGPADSRTITSRKELYTFCEQHQLDLQSLSDKIGNANTGEEISVDLRKKGLESNTNNSDVVQTFDQHFHHHAPSLPEPVGKYWNSVQPASYRVDFEKAIQKGSTAASRTGVSHGLKAGISSTVDHKTRQGDNDDQTDNELREITKTIYDRERKPFLAAERSNKRLKQQQPPPRSHLHKTALPRRTHSLQIKRHHQEDDVQEIPHSSFFGRHNPPQNIRQELHQLARTTTTFPYSSTQSSSSLGAEQMLGSISNLAGGMRGHSRGLFRYE